MSRSLASRKSKGFENNIKALNNIRGWLGFNTVVEYSETRRLRQDFQ